MDWRECCNKRIVKEVSLDHGLISSLIKSSANKLFSASELKISKVTAGSKVSLAYDSLREILEAFALQKGYKIYNHECYAAFLKEICGESAKGDEFDDVRKIRNAINYYGKDISVDDADSIIFRVIKLRKFIISMLKEV